MSDDTVLESEDCRVEEFLIDEVTYQIAPLDERLPAASRVTS